MNGIMNSLYPSVNSLEWRRSKVLELSSQGRSQPEIARILHISQPTINRDLQYLRQEAKKNIMRYIDEKLPEEYEKTLCGLNSILREAWNISAASNTGNMDKVKALNLAKDCYSMKLELLTNATVVDDAIRFVESNRKFSNSGDSRCEIIESINGVKEMKLKKELDRLPSKSNIEVVTVNKTF
jgi:Sigma-70, region 4